MQPMVLGVVVAVLVIILVSYALRGLRSPRHGRWTSGVLFAVGAIACGLGVFVEERWLLRLAYSLAAGLSGYAMVGTAMRWPGFRPEPPQDEEGDWADL